MTTASPMIFPMTLDVGSGQSMGAYLQAVNAAPMLEAEQEKALAVSYRDNEDLEAARQLVLAHLRYVVRVARGFTGYGLPLADLVQEGNIGLMKAVKRYDPDRDVRLVSFAIHWIRAEIYDYVLRNWRIVKVATTKAQRKLFFNLRKSRARLGWMKEAEIDTLAKNLDVDVSTVREMESRLTSHDIAFDGQDNDDDAACSPSATLGDMRYEPQRMLSAQDADENRNSQISTAMKALDNRSRDIVQRRWLNEDSKPTLHDLAHEYGVSAERIRQIEKRALEKMKDSIVLN